MRTQYPLISSLARCLETVIPDMTDGDVILSGQINFCVPPIVATPSAVPANQLVEEGTFFSNTRNIGPSTAGGNDNLCQLVKGLWYIQWAITANYGLAGAASGNGSSLLFTDPVTVRSFVLGYIPRGPAGFGFTMTGQNFLAVLTDGWQLQHFTPATAAGDFCWSVSSVHLSRVS